ncbi:MAG: hypothetical protein K2L61_02025, partial [Clostridia bacterium]|nr:hypothetical protein [Clostridia bacterium]
MRKTKFITVLLLIAVLATALLATLVACKPKESGNETNSGTPSGSPPPSSGGDPGQSGGWKPNPGPGDPEEPEVPTYTITEMFNKIVESVEVPEQALNIDISAKVDTDDKLTTLNLKGNFYSEVRNELCFAVYQQEKGEADSERQLAFAIYIVNDKIYLDLADGSTPLIYLSDFDFNYLIQIIEGAGGMLSDLIGDLDLGSYKGLIDFALDLLFGTPEVTVNEDGSQSIAMEVRLKTTLGSAGALIGLL